NAGALISDIHGGPVHKTLQSEAGYIDARPRSDRSMKTSCDARPDHTSGQAVSNCGNTQAYGITSSARTTIERGTVRPSALAVLRFRKNSYFPGNGTGRSPGFAPRRMRATYEGARRGGSGGLGPKESKPPFLAKPDRPYTAGTLFRAAADMIGSRCATTQA